MLKNRLILCGESVIRDAETNRMSVINLTENIAAQSFPAFIPKISVLGVFTREQGDAQRATLRLTGKIGTTELINTDCNLNFEDKTTTRFMVAILGFALIGPGKLVFTFFEAKKKLGSLEIPILLQGEPEIKKFTDKKGKATKRAAFTKG